jgi:hypothetical protein
MMDLLPAEAAEEHQDRALQPQHLAEAVVTAVVVNKVVAAAVAVEPVVAAADLVVVIMATLVLVGLVVLQHREVIQFIRGGLLLSILDKVDLATRVRRVDPVATVVVYHLVAHRFQLLDPPMGLVAAAEAAAHKVDPVVHLRDS